MSHDRRAFLASMGAATLAGIACGGRTVARRASGTRGLAPGEDFLFEPGLAYLQTGSMGPTVRPVLERAIEVWKQLERDPSALGYSTLQQGMEGVRAKAAALLHCTVN